MENITIDLPAMFEEIKERAFAEGAFTHEEWSAIVDEVLDAKQAVGESHDDVDWEEMRDALRARYDEFESEVPVA